MNGAPKVYTVCAPRPEEEAGQWTPMDGQTKRRRLYGRRLSCKMRLESLTQAPPHGFGLLTAGELAWVLQRLIQRRRRRVAPSGFGQGVGQMV